MQVAQGWSVHLDRGPDWLFVNLRCEEGSAEQPTQLAENLWSLLNRHFHSRMVVDLDEVPVVSQALLNELVQLNQRVQDSRGVLRLCGVNGEGQQSIRAAELERLFPCYPDRAAAVNGERPRQPR